MAMVFILIVIVILALVVWWFVLPKFAYRASGVIPEDEPDMGVATHFDDERDYEPGLQGMQQDVMDELSEEERHVSEHLANVAKQAVEAAAGRPHQTEITFEEKDQGQWQKVVKESFGKRTQVAQSQLNLEVSQAEDDEVVVLDEPIEKKVHATETPAPDLHLKWAKVNTAKEEQVPVLSIYVMGPRTRKYSGEELAKVLKANGLALNDRGLFVSHDNRGHMLFSVASAVKPGVFRHETLSLMQTPGLVFILECDKVLEPKKALKKMLAVVHNVATSLDADILDSRRERLTEACISEYLATIKAVEARQVNVN